MARKSRRRGVPAATGPRQQQGSSAQPSVAAEPKGPPPDGLLDLAAEVMRVGRWRLTARQAEYTVLAVIVAAAAVLLLANLWDRCLWQDEAQTALIAQTVLTDGFPRGTDGKNSFSQEDGGDHGPAPRFVWRLHAWLQFYLLAAFFGVLGAGTFTSRLPFALAGLASIPLTYFFARTLWQSRRAAAFAAILLCTSVPFLVLSRQCRYYSLSALFSVLGLWAYCLMIERKRWATPIFVAAAVLLFHSHYPCWAVLVATVLAHALLFHRDRFVAVAVALSFTLLVDLPWIVWLWDRPQLAIDREQGPTIARTLVFPWFYFRLTCRYLVSNILVGLLWALGVVAAIRQRKFPRVSSVTLRGATLALLFVAANMLVFSAVTPLVFFRYLGATIPILCVLGGRILESAARLHAALGISALAAILLVSPIDEFVYELTHSYRGPIEGMVSYLNEHGRPDDVVATTYDDMSLKFYTPMRVWGGLTGEVIPPDLKPDWLIIRRDPVGDRETPVRKSLVSRLNRKEYKRIKLNYPDVLWGNREEPATHRYETPPSAQPLILFERKKE